MEKTVESNWNNGKRSGWSREEELLLKKEAEQANQEKRPIKTVFQKVAQLTGRKPNSVRNYYYARMKLEGKHSPAFELFSQEEIRSMLVQILSSQAKGISVRACTLQMGNGDNKAMLRYQNKYRSVVKNNPALVREVIASMKAQGLPVYDPYVLKEKEPCSGELPDMISGIVKNAQQSDVDVTMLFEGLFHLSQAAKQGRQVVKKVGKQESELQFLRQENTALEQKIQELEEKLEESQDSAEIRMNLVDSNRENLSRLLGMFRQLVRVNKEFLCQNAVIKVSNLSDYIAALSRAMEDCERVLVDYAK